MLLSRLLCVRPGVTALTGGGGKTAAMYRLARELRREGTVICTTTTRILPPDHLPVADGGAELAAALADYVRVEADGSRGLPVKAHLAHEPAVPPEAGLTVVLAGASGFGRPVREAVHRPERFCALTGAAAEEPVTAENLARLLEAEGIGDMVFINQAESAGAMEAARRLAGLASRPVFAGSLRGGIWTCLS